MPISKYRPNTAISVYGFLKGFPDEAAALAYLEQKRWNGNITCPRCGSTKIGKFGKDKNWHRCNNCKKPFNVKTCTIFERSKIPLCKWLYAFYLILTARKGVSSLQISKELGITQKSAWFMLHRVREAMKSKNFILDGIVECDETYIGGKKRNKHWDKKFIPGRGPVGKIPVFGMVERNGRAKSVVVDNTGKNMLQGIIRENVEQGTTICTDEWKSYIGLNKDYTHLTMKHNAFQFKDGIACTNSIESRWAILKRGYHGVYHCMSPKHLQRYADEFDFRHNEGNVKFHTMDRVDSLTAGCWGARLTWKRLVNEHVSVNNFQT
ncbi:MAG: IS1595 family transposase [Fibromonadaceae bacterium]|nr:IS1595 family transposase [Fibromonadaceae bacterium]